MLRSLHLKGVGPAREIGPVEFAPRMNFITGDNGLGKSFLLDVAWWALTRTWARQLPAAPRDDAKQPAIAYAYSKSTPGDFEGTVRFDFKTQTWPIPPGRPAIPGVVIYAGVDGSFSAWDPARNYWSDKETVRSERLPCFDFSPEQVWQGLPGPGNIRYCNGLIQDWVSWQSRDQEAFSSLVKVLDALSPSGDEHLVPGEPVRLSDVDVTDHPSLRMPYGQDVPLIHASAGMRRVAALAYLLVWTWREHEKACKRKRCRPAKEIVFLIDEVECHLHPQWQRRIVPALLNVMKALTSKKVPVQLIAATHSPLVLASVEPEFEDERDALFGVALRNGQAVIEHEPWAKQGDVTNWLVSDAFGLKQARSVQAEEAIEAAETWMRGERKRLPAKLNTQEKIHEALVLALPGGDHFWPRWVVWTELKASGKGKEPVN